MSELTREFLIGKCEKLETQLEEAKKEIENNFEKIQSLEHNLKSSRFLRNRLEQQNRQLIEALKETDSLLEKSLYGEAFDLTGINNRIGNNEILLNQLTEK